jgi:hypothetical protein
MLHAIQVDVKSLSTEPLSQPSSNLECSILLLLEARDLIPPSTNCYRYQPSFEGINALVQVPLPLLRELIVLFTVNVIQGYDLVLQTPLVPLQTTYLVALLPVRLLVVPQPPPLEADSQPLHGQSYAQTPDYCLLLLLIVDINLPPVADVGPKALLLRGL